ncbi:AAA family ATPase [Psychrobacillus sp. FJAT-51614]|uniref:AAA family ATPase n=1 Tax=Psychrobacillus mangrovi TaxID=3117745 RepID=A0ABU8F752_9BACI
MNSFVLLSNRIWEFEYFERTKIFFWARGMAVPAPNQKNSHIDLEQIGDVIYLVSGAAIRNNCVSHLKDKVTSSPMLAWQCRVKEIVDRPTIQFYYFHGKKNSRRNRMTLPFEYFKELQHLDTFNDEPFSETNREHINQYVQAGEILNRLYEEGALEFAIGHENEEKKLCYIYDEERKLRHVSMDFPYVDKAEIVEIQKLRKEKYYPTFASFQHIQQAYSAAGLNTEFLLEHMSTGIFNSYSVIEIEEELYIPIHYPQGLPQGISVRYISQNSGNDLVDLIEETARTKRFVNSVKGSGNQVQHAKNQIFYGPPGTGKTYSVVRKAIEIVNPSLAEKFVNAESETGETNREQWVEAYKQYIEQKQIQFCTFHQSYSYEDFVEGLRSDDQGSFVPTDGIFKEICEAAKLSAMKPSTSYVFDENEINFFKMSLGDSSYDEEIYDYCIDNDVIALGYGGEIDYQNCEDLNEIRYELEQQVDSEGQSKFVAEAVHRFKNRLSVDDIVIVSDGNHYIKAIGKVAGEYYFDDKTDIAYNHFRKVEWLYTGELISVTQLSTKIFSQQTIYELKMDNLNIDFIKQLLSNDDTEGMAQNYVLIIDEINRGNISRIFGELITLIEDDKRLGEANEIVVKLPYSKDFFGVPSNLYIIGTMNTADRSITLMDTALRRRFDFIEMMPDSSLLSEDVDGINVRKLLEVMNTRIEYLYDRDHQIGHAFFLGKELSVNFIIQTIQKKVIPLLHEYFYDDWEKVALVLGGSVEVDQPDGFIQSYTINPSDLFKETTLRLKERTNYVVNPTPSKEAIHRIY